MDREGEDAEERPQLVVKRAFNMVTMPGEEDCDDSDAILLKNDVCDCPCRCRYALSYLRLLLDRPCLVAAVRHTRESHM